MLTFTVRAQMVQHKAGQIRYVCTIILCLNEMQKTCIQQSRYIASLKYYTCQVHVGIIRLLQCILAFRISLQAKVRRYLRVHKQGICLHVIKNSGVNGYCHDHCSKSVKSSFKMLVSSSDAPCQQSRLVLCPT